MPARSRELKSSGERAAFYSDSSVASSAQRCRIVALVVQRARHDLASPDLRDVVLRLYDPVRGIRAGQRRTSDNMEVRGEPRVRVGKGLEDVCEKSDEVCLLLQ